MTERQKRTPLLLWPFVAIWRLVTWILSLTGRLVIVILGFVLLTAGVILSATVIGVVLGAPMVIFGILLILRGLF